MARQMSSEKEMAFIELSKFLEYYSIAYLNIERSSEIHPSNVLEKIAKEYGRSKAFAGIRQAINDIIENTQDMSPEKISVIDEDLLSHGLVSISTLRKRYWSKYKKLMSRQIIKNETEYYLAVGLLNDMTSGLDADERENLSRMVNSFEEKDA